MKYIIRVTETLSKSFIVEAENESEARNKIDDAHMNGEIVLAYNDYSDYEILCDGAAKESDEGFFPVWEE